MQIFIIRKNFKGKKSTAFLISSGVIVIGIFILFYIPQR